MKEIWKDIKGWEGLYQVSTLGRVKSLHRDIVTKGGCLRHSRDKILKPKRNLFGYLSVRFQHKPSGRNKFYMVHRLVADAFIVNSQGLPFINHKDENKENNVYSNLEWCTAKYNVNYGTCQERRRLKLRLTNCNCRNVRQKTMDGKEVKIYHSISEAAREMNVDKSRIYQVCRGINHSVSCCGFKWEYV